MPFCSRSRPHTDLQMGCRNGNVGAPTIALNIVVNMVVENKRVAGEHISQKAPPPPCFCVCAGMIGLTGTCRGCTGIIGLSMRKSETEAKDEDMGRLAMAQERRPLSITGGVYHSIYR